MIDEPAPVIGGMDLAPVLTALRQQGAVFAYLHGSQAAGAATGRSDVDIAAWFGKDVDSWVVASLLPGEVDLLVLDSAPLELAGRVAQRGQLLFEEDAAARVRWQATTLKIYLDELPRRDQARRDYAEALRHG